MAAVAPPPAPPSLDVCAILTESKRIINGHTRHFLALSVLFLLPLSFSITVYPTLQALLTKSTIGNSKILLFLTPHHHPREDPSSTPFTTETLLLSLPFSLFVFAFALFAIGSITHSVFHGFYGRPVKLFSAIKSAFTSFFPLFITVFFSQIIVLGVFLVFVVFLFLVIKAIELVGFKVDSFSSPYFTGFCVIVAIILVLVLVHLQLNWALVFVISVVESSWGLEPFKRSSFLIEGMRRTALSLRLFFGFLAGILVWMGSGSGASWGYGTSYEWKSWIVVQIVANSTLLMLLFLYNVAANTVLYMYCKAVHGELAWEIAEEFAREYVSLRFDDGKVPHLVSIVHT